MQYDTPPIEVEPGIEVLLGEAVKKEVDFASSERSSLIQRVDMMERRYNLRATDDPVFKDGFAVEVPATVARVDRVSSELAGAFDRDGSPVFVSMPVTSSMTEHSQYAEKMFHQMLRKTDFIRHFRTATKRAAKVGVGVLSAEIISRPILQEEEPMTFDGLVVPQEEEQFENVLVVRSPKIQDMYVSPMNIGDLSEAAFVGERFQLPKWLFDDAIEAGFYSVPLDYEMRPGYHNDEHGQREEQDRLGYTATSVTNDKASEFYDLVRGWIRWRAPGEKRYGMYYVVFPVADPTKLLRVQKNPYPSLDRPPYVFMQLDEGDGSIIGRGYVELLEDMQSELNVLHALRVESLKRAYSKVWIAKEGSPIADAIESRRTIDGLELDGMEDPEAAAAGIATAVIQPNEVFVAQNPAQDLVGISMADFNPSSFNDESLIQQYMDMATVDNNPLQGIRTAFEVRQAASETAAKLKQYLKVIASTGMRPFIEIVRAQTWDYLMSVSDLDENIRFIEYGDFSWPITKTDYFNGFDLEPAGVTTSADEMIALTNTASLMSELVPLIVQMPGLVPDPAKSVREIVKMRARALGMENFEVVFGLTDPTPEQMQKAMMYRQIVMGASQQGQEPGFQMPGGMMGGMQSMMPPGGGAPLDGAGGAVQGAPELMGGAAFAGPQQAAEQNGGNVG